LLFVHGLTTGSNAAMQSCAHHVPEPAAIQTRFNGKQEGRVHLDMQDRPAIKVEGIQRHHSNFRSVRTDCGAEFKNAPMRTEVQLKQEDQGSEGAVSLAKAVLNSK
jgi:hypothetical protein